MKLMNFDAEFQTYTIAWMDDNIAKFGNNYDRMEAEMPEVYLGWLNLPADWLEGKTPGTYFAQFDDADMLIDWMSEYFAAGVPVPDQLLERITDLGPAAEERLIALLDAEDVPQEARLTAITLLSELESTAPMARYIGWIAAQSGKDERADMAAEALSSMGRTVVAPVLAAFDGATPEGQEAFLDVLCNYPGEEEIFTRAMDMFRRGTHNRAFFASMLGKLGDDRALPALLEAMNDDAVQYLDYVEMRNAVEALGGDAPVERIFDGDPYYESLRRME